MTEREELARDYDVIVVGSGAGGMVAALRAHDLGLSVLVVEKAHFYGGTSASAAGGIWVPMNPGVEGEDSVEIALGYLKTTIPEDVPEARLRAYVENALPMTRYLEGHDVRFFPVAGYPDYYSELPGALKARAMGPMDIDGADLGDDFFLMRDHHPVMLAFNRYALDWHTAKVLSERPFGWQLTALKMVARYWLDLPWRMKTRRDRRLTWGRGLVGMLRRAMLKQNIPLLLNCRLVALETQDGRVTAAVVERHGVRQRINAKLGVVLAAGGFEQNQQMRDTYMKVPTIAEASLAPKNGNKGDAIHIAQEIGAAVENMGSAWWTPSMRLPSRQEANVDVSYPLFFERALPGSLCVNRLGRRFVNEAVTYERFGRAMIEDQLATGANTPCWMIFDAGFRKANAVGGLMPSMAMPDSSLPGEWWDNVLFRAESIAALAEKIGLDPAVLSKTVATMNDYARTGTDLEFGRGSTPYDQFWGAKGVQPNNCLGPIERAPFYAVPVDLGDLGTNGGIKVNEHAAVLDGEGQVIEGLYATGNTIGSIFGSVYPGGGVTLGQATVYGYIAAGALAAKAERKQT